MSSGSVYDDYKFVTKTMLEEVGLEHLIGTNLLRAHMHGFFIDIRLYNRAKTVTQPLALRNHRRNKLRHDLQEQSTTLIAAKNHETARFKVNKDLGLKLQQATVDNENSKKVPFSTLFCVLINVSNVVGCVCGNGVTR